MRILFVIGSLREGGAEGQLVHLMRGLRARGHDVALMLLHNEGVRLAEVRAEGFEVLPVALPKFRPRWSPLPWFGLLGALFRTVSSLRRWQPDILHAWLWHAHVWAAAAHLLSGSRARLLTSRLQLGLHMDGKPWRLAMERLVNRRAAAVVANSREVARDTLRRERLPRRRLALIYGGIDAERWSGVEAADLRRLYPRLGHASVVAITVANLFAYKGYFDLIEAWRRIAREEPGACLLCVGADGGIRAELERRIGRLALESNVLLAGSCGNVPALTQGADFAVLASHEEGFSNVVLEAMACGRAIVATSVGGNPEAIVDGETGLLVPPRDAGVLAQAILKLVRSPDLRDRMGAAGAGRVRSAFSLERMIARHEALYRRLLDTR